MDTPPTSRHLRLLAGVGVGAAIGSAVAAIAASAVVWAVQASSDSTSSLTSAALAAMVTAMAVLALLGAWRRWRYPASTRARIVAGMVLLGLSAWSVSNVDGIYRTRDVLPFMDTAGVSVIAAAGAAAAVVAVLAAVATVARARGASGASGRAAVCAFLVVAVAAPAATLWAVQKHRGGVWQPDLTAAAAAPAPIPDTIGSVGYRMTVRDSQRPEIYSAGNGFLIDTGRELTAYDGVTGAPRWRVGGEELTAQRWNRRDYWNSGQVVVAYRDHDDATGVVVMVLAGGLIALDASSGEVLWRRQLASGKVTSAAGTVDALGISVVTGDYGADGDSATRLYSLDPTTGRLRWSQILACSSPSLSRGTAGHLSFGCGQASIVDARTGNTIRVPGVNPPWAGPDAYVAAAWSSEKEPSAEDVTQVLDEAGTIVDEVPGTFPASAPRNGLLLVYGRGNTWQLRDYRTHRSIPVSIRFDPPRGLNDGFEMIWLNNKMLVTNRYNPESPLQIVDPTRPTDNPTTVAPPCPIDAGGLHAVAGAVVVQCDTAVIGLVPQSNS